jgi:putative peptide zinc metalloprotease protein
MTTQPFLASDWHRVAKLRLRLLEHVGIERHRYHGETWYTLHDRLTGSVHRITPSACLFVVRLDGVRTVDEVWTGLADELGAAAPGQTEIIDLLMMMHNTDLLRADTAPDTGALLRRHDERARQLWVRNLRSPISMQIPIFNPDRMLTRLLPIFRPLLGRTGWALWLALTISALVTVGEHWIELTEGFTDRLLAAGNILSLVVCYAVIKALHELGHGLVARHHGCPVPEMGITLIVLFPVPYVDASATAALPSKWARAHVAAAGILVEVILAAIAVHVWAAAEPGLVRLLAFNTMLIGGFSTLLVNGNPLLRFDGYYVLTDLIEVPNLAQRAQRYLGHLMDRYVYRLAGMQDFVATRGERIWMLLYAPASWCYRMLVVIGIAIYLASGFFFVGAAVALYTVLTAMVWPLAKALWRIGTGSRYRRRRTWAATLTFAPLAAIAALLVLVPVPLHTTAEGVVWLPDEAIVRAGTDGFVQTVQLHAGQQARPGDTLFTLENPVVAAHVQISGAKVDELRLKLAAEEASDRPAAEITKLELHEAVEALGREEARKANLVVRSAGSGHFQPIRPEGDMPGRYAREGEILGYVTPDAGRVVRAIVSQADIDLVRNHLERVTLRLADQATDVASAIVREVPGGRDELPHAALSTMGGGLHVLDPRAAKTMKTLERLFQFDLALPDKIAEGEFGSRLYVRFTHTWEPLASSVYRRLRQAFLRRFDA